MSNIRRQPKFLSIFAALTPIFAGLATEGNAQTVPTSFPAAIVCYVEADQSWRVGYLLKVNKSGDASYIAPNGSLTLTVDTKGLVKLAPAVVDCSGKTLDELRSMGRTLEFRRKD